MVSLANGKYVLDVNPAVAFAAIPVLVSRPPYVLNSNGFYF